MYTKPTFTFGAWDAEDALFPPAKRETAQARASVTIRIFLILISLKT
jgi:hypothetical protein